MLEFCRICGETTKGTNAKDLFDTETDDFVRQIELITGEWLTEESYLPSYICICCEQDLNVAVTFRERCVSTQIMLRKKMFTIEPDSSENDPLTMPNAQEGDGAVESCKEELIIENDDTYTNDVEIWDPYCDENESNSLEYDMEELKRGTKQNFMTKIHMDNSNISLDKECPTYGAPSASQKLNNELESPITNNITVASPGAAKLHAMRYASSARYGKHRKRSTINWRKLTQEEAVEMHRLQRMRDCICDQCGRHFTDPSNFKLHILRHTGIKNYECDDCKMRFYTSHLLRRHKMIAHSGIPLYRCQYCQKPFNYSKDKIKHERIHTNERPFKCATCEKSFRTKEQEKEHQLVHTGVRNFHCDICDKWFLARKSLKAHFKSKTHHEGLTKAKNK